MTKKEERTANSKKNLCEVMEMLFNDTEFRFE